MSCPRLFCHHRLHTGLVTLSPDNTKHLRVLRLRVGDALVLFDGHGGEYQATLMTLDPRRGAEVNCVLHNVLERESPLRVGVAQAIIHATRMDMTLQKSVELGAHHFIPLICEFSAIKQRPEVIEKRYSHWQKVVIAASEQCGRNTLMQLAPPVRVDAFCHTHLAHPAIVCDPSATAMFQDTLQESQLTLLFGPEGGFSPSELKLFACKQLPLARLGPRILRSETALIAGLSIIQHRFGDLT